MTSRVIVTSSGCIVGHRQGGTTAYLGIPFAAPPIGELRFAAPRPHSGWSDPWAAETFGATPVQPPAAYLEGLSISEDSLTLNVWVPDTAAGAPVLFWVYGGGFQGGSSALPIFDGARLAAEQGIIVISANHRTGVLGFATLVDHGLPEASNLGVQDVIAALRWVHENAAALGGDPGRVTVMGQSSGAFISAALLAAPAARGLFQRLVLISGGASRIVPGAQARHHAEQFLAACGIGAGPESAARLRSLTVTEVVEAQRRVGSHEIGPRNGPVPDSLGVVLDLDAPHPVLDGHPLRAIVEGRAATTPLLFVVAGAEVASLRGQDDDFVPTHRSRIVAELERWGAPDPEHVATAYDDSDLGLMRERILTDYIYRLPAARAALAQNEAGGCAWVAQLDQPDDALASHDLPAMLLFGNLPDGDPSAALSRRLREMVGGFVRTGSADWERFDAIDSDVMHLGSGRRAVPASFAGLLRRWEGTPRP